MHRATIDLPSHEDAHPQAGVTGRYVWLLLLAVAMGFFEAAVVVYLRELYYPNGFRFPIVMAPPRVAAVEIARELASLLLLVAAARLAGRFFLERFGAFCVLFGTWDLFYYVFLKLILGWPESLATWDILFLIPVPWVGPVWAPCAVSIALVAVGSRLYLTRAATRRVTGLDWAIGASGGLLVILSMTALWRVVLDGTLPQAFPAGLFWLGMAIAAVRFAVVERRASRV